MNFRSVGEYGTTAEARHQLVPKQTMRILFSKEYIYNSSLSNIHPEPLRILFQYVLPRVKIVQCQLS